MSHGTYVRTLIDDLRDIVICEGDPVIVDGTGTVEVINHSYSLKFNSPIDMANISLEIKEYYNEKGLDLEELEQLEAGEYATIEDALISKFEYFKDDIHSRRVLWTDDCCISMIQYLIRNNKIYCFVNFRSSDVVYKLFSDLKLILKITSYLQEYLKIDDVEIQVDAHSLHEVIMKTIKK